MVPRSPPPPPPPQFPTPICYVYGSLPFLPPFHHLPHTVLRSLRHGLRLLFTFATFPGIHHRWFLPLPPVTFPVYFITGLFLHLPTHTHFTFTTILRSRWLRFVIYTVPYHTAHLFTPNARFDVRIFRLPYGLRFAGYWLLPPAG